MMDKNSVSLHTGDLVELDHNVSPQYVAGALCKVVAPRDRRTIAVVIEKMRPGRNMSNPRYREGQRIGVYMHTIKKV